MPAPASLALNLNQKLLNSVQRSFGGARGTQASAPGAPHCRCHRRRPAAAFSLLCPTGPHRSTRSTCFGRHWIPDRGCVALKVRLMIEGKTQDMAGTQLEVGRPRRHSRTARCTSRPGVGLLKPSWRCAAPQQGLEGPLASGCCQSALSAPGQVSCCAQQQAAGQRLVAGWLTVTRQAQRLLALMPCACAEQRPETVIRMKLASRSCCIE